MPVPHVRVRLFRRLVAPTRTRRTRCPLTVRCAWAGKAGAYGIQDRDDPFVECVAGSFENVMGLPVEMVGRMLAAIQSG